MPYSEKRLLFEIRDKVAFWILMAAAMLKDQWEDLMSGVKRRSSGQRLVHSCALKPHDSPTGMRKPTRSLPTKGGRTERGRRIEASVESNNLDRMKASFAWVLDTLLRKG